MDGIKKMFFYVIRSYKKIISIFIIIIFILILLAASLYQIKIDDGTFEEDEWSNTPYVASTYTSSANIGSNGITTDSTAKELWEKTIQEGSNIDKYLDSPEELEKLMNAELITQYPKIDTAAEGVINGIIEFERNKTDGTSCKLKYLDKEKFNTYVNSNSITTSEGTSILDYFTIDEMGHRKKLKEYFIEQKVPVSKRGTVPLVAAGSEILWMPGGRTSENYRVYEDTEYILIITYHGGIKHD